VTAVDMLSATAQELCERRVGSEQLTGKRGAAGPRGDLRVPDPVAIEIGGPEGPAVLPLMVQRQTVDHVQELGKRDPGEPLAEDLAGLVRNRRPALRSDPRITVVLEQECLDSILELIGYRSGQPGAEERIGERSSQPRRDAGGIDRPTQQPLQPNVGLTSAGKSLLHVVDRQPLRRQD
jgi:hypothetical protein